jgi:hypothetical protein
MNRATVDESLKRQLDGLAVPVEVVDEAGRPLGHFVPRIAMNAPDDCPYSVEQLEAMRSESGGRTLPQIWATLETK